MMDVDQEEDLDENLASSDPCQVMGVGNEMERDEDPNEVVLSVITGKRPRYTRKIDALVDDLIRKTNRTLDWNNRREGGCSSSSSSGAMHAGDVDLFFPEIRTPGPHPGSDQRLMGKLRNREEDMLSLIVLNDPVDTIEEEALDSNPVACSAENERTRNTHSGNISHSDWPIEFLE